MVISDSYSDKTSSTLPIIISFSSHLKTNKIKQIRNILSHHPNCQKYVTKGPNFVADGINEFRLYYVDSSLYSDDITLKKLTVEKEEIVFGNTTDDSLEPPYNIPRTKKLPSLYSNKDSVRIEIPKRYDKSTKCTQHSRCYPSAIEIPRVMKKVSKSFQIGPDLRFNVVYVNTEIPHHSFNYKTTEASVQTEQVQNQNILDKSPEVVCSFTSDSNIKIPIRDSPSFLFGNHNKPEKKNLTTYKTFCSKMEEKKVFKFTDSEINVESRTTSVKYSIKKSPSFLANYILEILNTRTSHENIRNSGIFEQSIVNYLNLDDFKKRIAATKTYDLGMKNDFVRYENKSLKYDRKSPQEGEVDKKNTHRKKGEKIKQNNEYPKNCNYIDKLSRYHNTGKPNCYKVHCLFKCTNMDFLFRRSHYAILKKYHRKLQENRHKREKHHHNHRHKRDYKKQTENKIARKENFNSKEYNTNNQKLLVHTCQGIPHNRKTPSGESKTKTTISAFLQSYRHWHWKDNSKLSVCFDEEFSTG